MLSVCNHMWFTFYSIHQINFFLPVHVSKESTIFKHALKYRCMDNMFLFRRMKNYWYQCILHGDSWTWNRKVLNANLLTSLQPKHRTLILLLKQIFNLLSLIKWLIFLLLSRLNCKKLILNIYIPDNIQFIQCQLENC